MNKVGVWSPVIWKIQPFVDKEFIDRVLFFYFTQRFSDENTDHVSSSFSSLLLVLCPQLGIEHMKDDVTVH